MEAGCLFKDGVPPRFSSGVALTERRCAERCQSNLFFGKIDVLKEKYKRDEWPPG